MFKSKFLKSFLIILAILIIGGVGYTVWRARTEQKINKLLSDINMDNYIREDGRALAFDFDEPAWNTERNKKLTNLGKTILPTTIEIVKKNKNIIKESKETRNRAIYILGCIGGEQAVDVLVNILKSQYEYFDARAYAAEALEKNKTNPKALEALTFVASNEHENDVIRQWAQGALYRINNR